MSEEDSNLSQDSDEYRRWKAGGKTDVVHLCPRGCKGSLIEEDGLLMCNECDGVKFSVGMLAEGTRSPLEQMTGDHRVRDALLQFIRMGKESDLNCALCNKKMSEIELQYDPNQVANYQPVTGWDLRHMVRSFDDHPIFLVIGAVLTTAEVELLKREKDFILIKVTAPSNIRLKRIINRNREKDPKTLEELKEKEARENTHNKYSQQLNKVADMATKEIINDSTFEG